MHYARDEVVAVELRANCLTSSHYQLNRQTECELIFLPSSKLIEHVLLKALSLSEC